MSASKINAEIKKIRLLRLNCIHSMSNDFYDAVVPLRLKYHEAKTRRLKPKLFNQLRILTQRMANDLDKHQQEADKLKLKLKKANTKFRKLPELEESSVLLKEFEIFDEFLRETDEMRAYIKTSMMAVLEDATLNGKQKIEQAFIHFEHFFPALFQSFQRAEPTGAAFEGMLLFINVIRL
ncbi:uncharacterized protein LOC129795100 [Lutzomyia longipalpis]|uniref:uncharacterized protein LOC129795100 n=1 Tax=Lutzomyia longipalpis TaxID=7200 RepID=UPI002483394A|nr:uncharacterized protein LOC129795100 [Lutzomyia longipalpis]